MGKTTRIEWCHHTFNPWRGCKKVSAGCAHCYAERQSRRNPGVLGVWGDAGTRVVASESAWRAPELWDRAAAVAGERRRVFGGSMCDVFEDRPDLDAPRSRLFDLIDRTPWLDWLLLTKRPENIARLMPRPRANVWLGTSVEDQQTADARIPHLLCCPATVRFLSCEPLLGPLKLDRLCERDKGSYDKYQTCLGEHAFWQSPGEDDAGNATMKSMILHCGRGLDCVIVGGESGPNARPCNLEWVRSIRDQCRAAGVGCFIKQLGAAAFSVQDRISHRGCTLERPVGFYRFLRDPKGGDPSEWPEDLRVREFPR